ncbi:hypothetical protein N7L96_04075 [Mammaliicoccus sciuri]|uniref:hypothetical protein n=1 Tax=Mammaliicoccus TaxID=2803850 RepID=UPI001EFABB06|nr:MULTISPECIES: hypothetical protein [Mammaliicoccus]MCJ0918417.1 hypothetical protein [Mammaliicoccus sciuri]MCJ0956268.1 hypothetical protein [Mammaliicoccus sciuri]MCJ0961563.1 hypothetical protein [Mammaliicoccus sciuri]MCJ1774929.1 hypothetical protein [Mammaliicoccus sciuri]MDC5693772.1 hypothetical protein [Mammaliicoccus sciuri]
MKNYALNLLFIVILLFFTFNLLVLFNVIQIKESYSRVYGIFIIIFTILNLIYFKAKEKQRTNNK